MNPLKKSPQLQTNKIALLVRSESHVALDSLRPNTTPTRDLTLHWSWIHFSAEHKRRTNSFKPLLLHFCRVTLMGLNCSRQLVYNWNLRWSSADSFTIVHLCRSGRNLEEFVYLWGQKHVILGILIEEMAYKRKGRKMEWIYGHKIKIIANNYGDSTGKPDQIDTIFESRFIV